MAFTYTGKYTKSKNAFNINDVLNDPRFLEQLAIQTGNADIKRREKKANFLERLLGLPIAIGSIPDVIYQTKYHGRNPLEEYAKNLLGGVKATAVGEKQKYYYGKDLLKKADILQGDDPASKLGRGVVGFGIDVLADPLTYATIGPGGLVKQGAKGVATNLAKKAGKEGIESGLEKALVKGGISTGQEFLVKKGLGEYSDLLAQLAKGAPKAKSLNFMGKTITQSPKVTGVAGALINPLEGAARGSGAVLKKVSPDTAASISRTFNKAFNTAGLVKNTPLEPLARVMRDMGDEGAKRVERQGAMKLTKELASLGKTTDDLAGIFEREGAKSITEKYLVEIANNPIKYGKQGLDELMSYKRMKVLPKETMAPLVKNYKKALKKSVKGGVELPDLEKMLKEGYQTRIAKAGITGDEARILTEFGDRLAKRGMELKNKGIISSPLDVYMPRNVLGFKEEFIREAFGPTFADAILSDKAVQQSIKKNKGYIGRDVMGELMAKTDMAGMSAPFGGGRPGFTKERMFEQLLEGKKAGVVYEQNAAKSYADYMVGSKIALERKEIVAKLSNLTDLDGKRIFLTEKDFGGFVPPTMKKLSGELSDYYVPREAFDLVNSYMKNYTGDEGISSILKIYDSALGFWKQTVTAFGPNMVGYNIRNAYSDMGNMVIGGFGMRGSMPSVKEMLSSFKMGIKADKFDAMVAREGLDAARSKYGDDIYELWQRGNKSGMVSGSQALDEALGSADNINLASKGNEASKGIVNKYKKVRQIATAPGLARENAFRYANLWDHYKQTGSWDTAIEKARLSSLDYNNLTPFERQALKRVIPFYSFFRQNLELQLTTLNTKPGLLLAQQKFLRNLYDTLSDGGATEEDYNALPDWMRDGFSRIIKKDGREVSVLTDFGDATSSLNDYFGDNIPDTLRALMGKSAPPLKMAMELATGRNMFTNEMIEDDTSGRRYANYPDWAKEAMGVREYEKVSKAGDKYIQYEVDPMKKYLAQNMPVISSFESLLDRVTSGKSGAMGLASGVRVYDRNLDAEQRERDKEVAEELAKLLVSYGIAEPRYGVYLSPDLEKNSPEVYQFLQSIGYTPSKRDPKAQLKSAKRKEESLSYLEKTLDL